MKDRTDPEGGIPGRYELLNDRGKTHGDFTHNSRCAQKLKEIVRAEPGWNNFTTYQREATDMILHKIARALAGDPSYKDHWDDIAGYALLVSERLP